MTSVGRLPNRLWREGLVGTARLAVRSVKFDSAHVWYELSLEGDHPEPALDPSFSLVRSGRSELPLEPLWPVSSDERERRLADGGTLWLVLDGEQRVFSCWILGKGMRVGGAPGSGRWLVFPDDTVCLEESLTAAAYRGRGVAPAAWAAITATIAADRPEVTRIVTPVEDWNTPSRTAVEKVGFRELAFVRQHKRGVRLHFTVTRAVSAVGSTHFLDSLGS